MRVKVITLAYNEGLKGFPREPLEAAASEGFIPVSRRAGNETQGPSAASKRQPIVAEGRISTTHHQPSISLCL